MNKSLCWVTRQFKEFGFLVAISTALNKVYFYGVHNDEFAYRINTWKHKCIIRHLCKQYSQIINKYTNTTIGKCKSSHYDGYIWTIWWQGEENAPEALKMCYQSMRKFSNGHKVVVISQDNLNQYIEIPKHITKKVDDGKIDFIHFADIIRMYLLKEHGGMWLDATVFLTDSIPECIFEYPYYTGKLQRTRMSCVSEGRWNGTFFAGKPYNPFFEFMTEFYNEYWRDHNQVIDYFLIDYMTEIAYCNIPTFRSQLDSVPYNNKNIFMMGTWLNTPFNKDKFKFAKEDTSFHKLQRRGSYMKETENKELTFYGYLNNYFY